MKNTNESYDGEFETDSTEFTDADMKDNEIKSAISDIADICEKHGAHLGGKYDGGDSDYAVLRVKIDDPDKTDYTGFNMNYIMGVGHAIEEDMKDNGINAFVGAGGYYGCVTNIRLNKNEPYSHQTVGESYSKNNRKGYVAYVCVKNGKGWKIESGWEFRDDAKDRANELKEDFPEHKSDIRVFGATNAKHVAGDVDDNANWVSGHIAKFINESRHNLIDRATGFYDHPRTSNQFKKDFDSIESEKVIGYDYSGDPVYVHYDERNNTLFVDVNDHHVEVEVETDRDLDYNLQKLYDEVMNVTALN